MVNWKCRRSKLCISTRLKKIMNTEELQDKLWSEYAEEFAHAVLQDMADFSGDELFEIGE